MMSTIAGIAAGGALGALSRHFINNAALHFFGDDFPWATLGINVVGSCLMGAAFVAFAHIWQPSPALNAFIITGFLGGFTTFSAFSLDVITLWQRGDFTAMALYSSGSIIISIIALCTAMALTRTLIS